MRMTTGKLADLWRADPSNYEGELAALLGVTTDDDGYACIRDQVLKPRSLSIKDVGEAFVGADVLRHVYDRGPVALARMVAEESGSGALGPSQFQAINAWLGSVDVLLGAEMMEKYAQETMVARELVTWKMNIRIQENMITRYGFPTRPTQDIQPNQEFPSGDLAMDWVRANRMRKQGESLAITWEAMHFDQTDSI